MGISTLLSLDNRIKNAAIDGPSVMIELSKQTGSVLEMVSDLPAAPDPDIILSYVKRWKEIHDVTKKDLRIYAKCYSNEVEKYILNCVQNMSYIYVTIMPLQLIGEQTNAERRSW